MNDFDALLGSVLDAPLDAAPRLILADWCAEHGNEEMEMALRFGGKCLEIASATCRYKRKEKRHSYYLRRLWENFELIEISNQVQQRNDSMSLTYNNGSIYKGVIVKWGLNESKAKKTPQVFFTVTIKCETDEKGEEFECPNYERTIYRALTENTVDFVVEELARLGFKGTSFAQLNPEHPESHDFLDLPVVVKCKHETYQGKTSERFEFNFGGGGPKQMEMSATKKLDSMFGAKLKAASPSGTKSKSAPAMTPTEMEMEEVM